MTLNIRIALEVVACIVGIIAIGAYVAAREDQAKMQATLDAQKVVQAEYQKRFRELTKQMDDREAAHLDQIQALRGKFQSAATPEQLAKLVSSLMNLKEPATIKETLEPQSQSQTPVLNIPEIDFPQVKAYVQDCEECKLDRAKLTADAADRQAQAELAQKQIESLKTERDSAVDAARGGNWIRRAVKAAKYLAIGAVAGAVAVCGSGHCK